MISDITYFDAAGHTSVTHDDHTAVTGNVLVPQFHKICPLSIISVHQITLNNRKMGKNINPDWCVEDQNHDSQETRYTYPMFDQCWANVVDSGPTLVKLWGGASCLPGYVQWKTMQNCISSSELLSIKYQLSHPSPCTKTKRII